MAGRRALRRASVAIGLLVAVLSAGCASQQWVTVRSVPRNPLTERLALLSKSGPKATERTRLLLRRYDLEECAQDDPEEALGRLQQVIANEPTADKLYSFSELAYLAAIRKEARGNPEALNLYVASVAHAYLYLFDERFGEYRNPYDPQFRGACDLYNTALESAMRIVRKQHELRAGHTHVIESPTQTLRITVVSHLRDWQPEEIERFEFVSDYEIKGLRNHYHTYGLGVPMIAVRKTPEPTRPIDRHYPPGLSFPVTAFLRVLPCASPSEAGSRERHAVLELYDPLDATDILVHDRLVPLETDFSTPLAHFLNNPVFQQLDLATAGLLNPASHISTTTRGLYMLEPYQPGKIPVLMVHGLWSSPLTWMEMFNDLHGSRELRNRYQFWFYLYPTGQPFWQSATELREDLAAVRQAIDPHHIDPALDHMVLVGHSMGGLISQWQTLESSDLFWKLVSDRPLEELKAPEALRRGLAQTFFFEPNSSIKRVITIGTPYRGSRFSNDATRWLGQKLITLPRMFYLAEQQLLRENRDFFRRPNLFDIPTSIDSLAPDSPILRAMEAAPKAPWVTYHNIIAQVPADAFLGRLAGASDGVVAVDSARLPIAASEIVVTADHTNVHRHPLSVLEVRRILLEHAAMFPVSEEQAVPLPVPAALPFSAPPVPMAASPAG